MIGLIIHPFKNKKGFPPAVSNSFSWQISICFLLQNPKTTTIPKTAQSHYYHSKTGITTMEGAFLNQGASVDKVCTMKWMEWFWTCILSWWSSKRYQTARFKIPKSHCFFFFGSCCCCAYSRPNKKLFYDYIILH